MLPDWSVDLAPGCRLVVESALWPVGLFFLLGVALLLAAGGFLRERPRRWHLVLLGALGGPWLLAYGFFVFERQTLVFDAATRRVEVGADTLLGADRHTTLPFDRVRGVALREEGRSRTLVLALADGEVLRLERQPWASEDRVAALEAILAAAPGTCP